MLVDNGSDFKNVNVLICVVKKYYDLNTILFVIRSLIVSASVIY